MKISIWWSGKTKEPYVGIVKQYLDRCRRFHHIETKVFQVKKGLEAAQIKEREGEAMLKAMATNDHIILLDETGKNLKSREFAQFIEHKMLANIQHLIFIIGGPYGFAKTLYHRSQSKLALSKMTFTHDMVRIIFLEQIYRAFTIKNNLPYHHD